MTAAYTSSLCLTGRGLTAGLYQLGALSAFESLFGRQSFDLYIGTSSGATVAASLSGGIPVQRMYRALIDPADDFFPLERGHLLAIDIDEWKRTISGGAGALRHAIAGLAASTPTPKTSDIWEQLDRLFDALPAGLFSLGRFESFLSDFFLRRHVPNSFRAMDSKLLITSVHLDSGAPVVFGGPGHEHVPVSLACAASMAVPVFFSPVRVGDGYYLDGSISSRSELDIARDNDADFILFISPTVPLQASQASGGIPSGFGMADSLRDKGVTWVFNQALRTGVYARELEALQRMQRDKDVEVLALLPDPVESMRFVKNPASIDNRRELLEWSYRSTRTSLINWAKEHEDVLQRLGWSMPEDVEPSDSH